jgi:transposase-like protein
MAALFTTVFFLLAKFLVNREPITEQFPLYTQSNLPCPRCGSHHTIMNGTIHNGKPKCQCNNCGHQFLINPTKQSVFLETKQLIDKLLLERISLRGIARVTGVSWSWLQNYVNKKLS